MQTKTSVPVKVRSLDHIALLVHDLDASIHFYRDVLGLELRGEEQFRAGERFFVNVRAGVQVIDLVPSTEFERPARGEAERRGLTHMCLVVEDIEPERLIEYLRGEGVDVFGGPIRRGQRLSVDCYDPDNYFVELSTAVPGATPRDG
jgi:catechol 2,3-dioxygenase-like lactoylglutathione lyase family enzyme